MPALWLLTASVGVLIPIPADPALTGTAIPSQALAASAATPLGLATSNGLRLVLGL